jgi:hypothetical protein
MCLAALLISVSGSNCLAILENSTSVLSGCAELHAKAAEMCLSDLPGAMEADAKSFLLLSAQTLTFLLQHDDLRCSEEHIFLILLKWVKLGSEKGSRVPLLRQLAGSCIRPSQLSYNQLIWLDAHPEVSSCSRTYNSVS